ncbi:hypothetical protein V502_02272 [Pseudogymnoascus sp. VKM F-4520 (FW-2644)]|nr:hypothetical protein V502_02272 [Pseudogymnoascus sp. VKM F-4520 (FW-2644)]
MHGRLLRFGQRVRGTAVVAIDVEYMHRDEDHWGRDAEEFDPTRWLRGQQGLGFLPFGMGRFECPAKAIAGPMMVGVLAGTLVQGLNKGWDFQDDEGEIWNEVSLEMELGEGSRVLRGGRRSEEHRKLGDTVGGKGKGNGIGNSAPTRASQAPKSREITETDEDCTDADFDNAESTIIAATPTKRNLGRPKNGSKITTSQQPLMVDGTRGATNDRAKLQATLKELIKELQDSRNEIAELKTEWRAAVQRADNEIAELRSEISDLKATTTQFIARPPATWATVASIGNGPTSADASWSALPASQRPSNDPTWSSRPSQMDINTYHVREKTVIVNIGPL